MEKSTRMIASVWWSRQCWCILYSQRYYIFYRDIYVYKQQWDTSGGMNFQSTAVQSPNKKLCSPDDCFDEIKIQKTLWAQTNLNCNNNVTPKFNCVRMQTKNVLIFKHTGK